MSLFFFKKNKRKKKYLYVGNGNLLVSWRNGSPFWVYSFTEKKVSKFKDSNHREVMREERREIDTWTEMRREIGRVNSVNSEGWRKSREEKIQWGECRVQHYE